MRKMQTNGTECPYHQTGKSETCINYAMAFEAEFGLRRWSINWAAGSDATALPCASFQSAEARKRVSVKVGLVCFRNPSNSDQRRQEEWGLLYKRARLEWHVLNWAQAVPGDSYNSKPLAFHPRTHDAQRCLIKQRNSIW